MILAVVVGGDCEFVGSDDGLRASTLGVPVIVHHRPPRTWNLLGPSQMCLIVLIGVHSLHTHLGTSFLFSMSKSLGLNRMQFLSAICELTCASFALRA